MAGVINDQGLIDEAADLVTRWGGYSIFLFVNNHTPAPGDNFAAYTEPTYNTYARQTPASISAGSVVGNDIVISFGTNTFTVSVTGGTDQVYGCGMVDGSGNLVSAQLFSGGPFPMQTSGDNIAVNGQETMTRI